MASSVQAVAQIVRETLARTGRAQVGIGTVSALLFDDVNPDTHPQVAAQKTQYFKGVLNFHGLKSPEVNLLLKDLYSSHIVQLPSHHQVTRLVVRCFRRPRRT